MITLPPFAGLVTASNTQRDGLSALFHDYDWADEVLHVEIARRCLRPELPGGLGEAGNRRRLAKRT